MRADGVMPGFLRWREEGAIIREKIVQRRSEVLHEKEQAERDLAELDEAIAVLGAIGKP